MAIQTGYSRAKHKKLFVNNRKQPIQVMDPGRTGSNQPHPRCFRSIRSKPFLQISEKIPQHACERLPQLLDQGPAPELLQADLVRLGKIGQE